MKLALPRFAIHQARHLESQGPGRDLLGPFEDLSRELASKRFQLKFLFAAGGREGLERLLCLINRMLLSPPRLSLDSWIFVYIFVLVTTWLTPPSRVLGIA